MKEEKGSLSPVADAVLKTPFVAYSPNEIKRIRLLLGMSNQEPADFFRLSIDEIKAWQVSPDKPKHREPSPPAMLLLYWCAVAANERPSAKNNHLRLVAKYGRRWVEMG